MIFDIEVFKINKTFDNEINVSVVNSAGHFGKGKLREQIFGENKKNKFAAPIHEVLSATPLRKRGDNVQLFQDSDIDLSKKAWKQTIKDGDQDPNSLFKVNYDSIENSNKSVETGQKNCWFHKIFL